MTVNVVSELRAFKSEFTKLLLRWNLKRKDRLWICGYLLDVKRYVKTFFAYLSFRHCEKFQSISLINEIGLIVEKLGACE